MKSLEVWGHQHGIILNAGRISHALAPDVPEDQREEILAQLTEKDATCDRFRALNEDAPVAGLPANIETGFAWTVKVVGDP